MSMTSRERVEAALGRRTPDRTPFFEYCLRSPLADRLLGRPFVFGGERWRSLERESGWKVAVRRRATDQLDLAALLGHDLLHVTPNPAPSSTSRRPTGARKPAEDQEDDPVARVALRTEEESQTAPCPADECFEVYATLREEMRHRGMDLPILAPACVHGVWTDTDLMQTMLLAPDVAQRHFALKTRQALATTEQYLARGVEQVIVGGDFAGQRPLISPKAYRSFIVPEVRTVVRRIHASGGWAVNASDGNLWPMLDSFLFDCEVDAYLEIDAHAGMDLERLMTRCAGRMTFYGNLDCGNMLSFGSQEEIRGQVRNCLETGWRHGGHVLCASNAITASVSLENYLAVVETYRELSGLPPLRSL